MWRPKSVTIVSNGVLRLSSNPGSLLQMAASTAAVVASAVMPDSDRSAAICRSAPSAH